MNRSESIGKLAAALVKAQAALPDLAKDGVNPHFRSKYATLPEILTCVKKALNPHGLALVQGATPTEPGYVALETMLLHESGEWISDVSIARLSKEDSQGLGSCLTYLSRYGARQMTGLAVFDELDDDGNAASGPPRPPNAVSSPQAPRQAPPAPKGADWRGPMLAAVKGNVAAASALIGDLWVVPEGASPEDLVAVLEGADDATRRKIYRALTAKKGD